MTDVTGLGLSSATLRNEMSELCDMGFLEQPHTSAGRKPTSDGYGFYFEKLMNRREVPADLKQIIDTMLKNAANDPEHLVAAAGELLSELTGFPTVMATVTRDETYVKKVEMFRMGDKSVLLLLITSDGVARSRICRSAFSLAPDVLSQFETLLKATVIGKELHKLTPGYLQTVVARTGDLSLFMTPLLSSVFEMVEDIDKKSITVKGESRLVGYCESEYEARTLLTLLTKQELIFSLLSNIRGDTEVIFGDRTGIPELAPSSLVVAKYGIGNENIGRIGVLGPSRMAYEQLIPSVEYFASRFGSVMTEVINDIG